MEVLSLGVEVVGVEEVKLAAKALLLKGILSGQRLGN